jgi:hypothetical protein
MADCAKAVFDGSTSDVLKKKWKLAVKKKGHSGDTNQVRELTT